MADHFPFKLESDATIAVIGLPYTFRKEMGAYISNWAKCPNLTFEVILNELPNADEIEGVAADMSIDRSDVAFGILCKTPLSLLNRYQPNCVVINFPIPTKPQLEKLISLHGHYGRRLLIIECERRNKFRWRQAIEDPSRGIWWNRRYDTGNRRPGKWEDVEKAIQKHHQQQQQHLDATLASHNVYVKKLVVDPFQDLRSWDFTEREGLYTRSLFAEAIKCTSPRL